MKIGYAARYSPEDRKAWSGINYFTWQQLRLYGEVTIFQYPLPKWLQEWLTMRKSINRRIFHKQTAVEFTTAYARYFSRRLTRDLEKNPVDILFVPASSQLIAFVKTKIPVIYLTDATFRQLQGYYPSFSNLAEGNTREGVALDRAAFKLATHCILASDWCRQSAVADYGIPSSRISVVPFGANLEEIPEAGALQPAASGKCRLLFLGVEWDRKGGEIALETFRLLQKRNGQPHLHIIGCVPPYDLSGEKDISIIPFLDKNKPGDREQLYNVFRETDFLLLPSRAECAGIVYCEASAFGIPSLAAATGGVADYVRNGVNGFLLPPEAGAEDYAAIIEKQVADPVALGKLKESCRQLFEDELNWDQWGRQFRVIAANILTQKAGDP